ncbi:ribbon-helix-helix protein, CopG family [Kocuria indica]|uniref:Ribbon-helix-helix protein, CopG family n=1 Tax=Kocuria marina subsp. indica TaxID=1049583 RepID=A0A6N9R3G0_9MICC|nr:ribbon-helix-helix protein, CopG family [Kocuria indica]
MALSPARVGRPRIHHPDDGSKLRVEVRLPEDIAAIVYERASERQKSVSVTVEALLRDALGPEVIPRHTDT